VSILAEMLGMKVRFWDVVPKLPLGNAVAAASMDELLAHADYVLLHVPKYAIIGCNYNATDNATPISFVYTPTCNMTCGPPPRTLQPMSEWYRTALVLYRCGPTA
jgi:hypothetical protein